MFLKKVKKWCDIHLRWGRSSYIHMLFGISGSLIWSKTLMELIFNLCGEYRWSPESPVSQIHSLHLHVGAPDLLRSLRSVQMLKREWDAESNGKLLHLFIPSKTALLVPEFGVGTCLRQNCSVGSCACSEGPALGQKTRDGDDTLYINEKEIIKHFYRPIYHKYSAQRQVLHCKRRNLRCSSAEGSFTRDWICAVAYRCFPYHTLSLASEQTLKDLKRSHGHQREGEENGIG